MTKIDIVSGFLGAGKTTLIKKMLSEAYQGEKLVLIENGSWTTRPRSSQRSWTLTSSPSLMATRLPPRS